MENLELAEITKKLNNVELENLEDVVSDLVKQHNDIIIVYGSSDDLIETRGIVFDELNCYDYAGDIVFYKDNVFMDRDMEEFRYDRDNNYSIDDLYHIEKSKIKIKLDNETVCGNFKLSTDIPHVKYQCLEDGDFYTDIIVLQYAGGTYGTCDA